ncbi:proteasome subunit beta type 4 [Pelomyxa schiedti]|nr:proteasome subunit beta type 4 [Pelomyxa schiedti]
MQGTDLLLQRPVCAQPGDRRTRTTDPIVTGTTVLGLKFNGGVMLAADTLGSYGSLARFMFMERIKKIGNHTVIGGSGEMSDFQHITKTLEGLVREDYCIDDGFVLTPKEMFSYLNRVLYNRRSRFDPLWNDIVVIGWDHTKQSSFLGLLDKVGTAYEDNYVATGYGNYMSLPLLRAGWRPDLTKEEARALLEKAMVVLFFRDARTINRIQIGTVTASGVEVTAPFELDTTGQWNSGENAIRDDEFNNS